jgi:hypothetical protein
MSDIDSHEEELAWKAAAALGDEWSWIASALVFAVLSSDDAGLSVAGYADECSEGDWIFAYRLIGAVETAVEEVGLSLPWEPRLSDADLRLVLTDRDGARRLLSAMHALPMLEAELQMITAS